MAVTLGNFLRSSTMFNIGLKQVNKQIWGSYRSITNFLPTQENYTISFEMFSATVGDAGNIYKRREKYNLPLDVALRFLKKLNSSHFSYKPNPNSNSEIYSLHHRITGWEIISEKKGRVKGNLATSETPRSIAHKIALFKEGGIGYLPE